MSIHTHVIESLCWTPETSTILSFNYIKKKKKGIVVLETQILVKPKECFEEEKESGAYKDKKL